MQYKHLTHAISLVAIFGLTVACSSEEAPPSRDSAEAMEIRQQAMDKRATNRVPEQVDSPVTGEVPEGILLTIRTQLARYTDVDPGEPVMAKAVTWPSGALGCPKPGRVYQQVVVPGYHVVFEAGDERWDFRATETGGVVLCEDNISLDPPDSSNNPAM